MKLAVVCLMLSGCIFENEGVAPELSNLSCTPTSLAAAPYHVACSVDIRDEDRDTQDVSWVVTRQDNYAVVSGSEDLPRPLPSEASVSFAFDLPSPIMAGTYTLTIDVIDVEYGNGDRMLQPIVVQ